MITSKSHRRTPRLFFLLGLLSVVSVAWAAGSEQVTNTFLGLNAGLNNTAEGNTFVGADAGRENGAFGFQNSFFGRKAGERNSTGDNNSFYGHNAGKSNTSGSNNSYFGDDAGRSNSAGNNNAIFGENAGYNVTSGENAFFGHVAGYSATTGKNNSFYGHASGFHNTTATANSFFGMQSGFNNTTGASNSFFGKDAGFLNTTGGDNSFYGFRAGYSNTTGHANSIFGRNAGASNEVGTQNSFFGENAGNKNEGSFNSFFGEDAGKHNVSGEYNTFVGRQAGENNTIGNNSTIVGGEADMIDGLDNATALGYRAHVNQSNSLVLGSIGGVNGAVSDVNVGIGTTAPAVPLHIRRSDGTGSLMVEETGSGGSASTLVALVNDGPSTLNMEDTSLGQSWYLMNNGGGFEIGRGDQPALLVVENNGDVTVSGTLTEQSDVNAKQDIQQLEGRMVLAKLEQLPVTEWSYRDNPESRHIGPMAQDFRKAFGLGRDETQISPRDMAGVALSAIKALQTDLQQKDDEIAALKSQNAAVMQRLAQLEKALSVDVESVNHSD